MRRRRLRWDRERRRRSDHTAVVPSCLRWSGRGSNSSTNLVYSSMRIAIRCTISPHKYFEKVLRAALGGSGVDEDALTRVVVTRAEKDLRAIKEISKDYKSFLLALLAYNLLRRPDGTFNRHLAEFLDRKVSANAAPVDGVISFDVIIDRPTNLLTRVYRPAPPATGDAAALAPPAAVIAEMERPPSPTPFPVIIFFHGGSFAHSSSNSAIYDSLCRRFVSMCNAVVVSVNYRRSPEHRFPCAYDDGWTALRWVTTRPWLRSGEDSKVRVFLCGDSSGGNIAHHVAVRAGESGIPVSGNILLNPMFGGEGRKESELMLDGKYFVTIQDRDWYWRAFLPEGADRDHPACNPFGPNGVDLAGIPFPKSLVVVAGLDLISDWQLSYAESLQKAGQEVNLMYLKQATIGFYLLPNNNHFFLVMDEIKNFVNSDT